MENYPNIISKVIKYFYKKGAPYIELEKTWSEKAFLNKTLNLFIYSIKVLCESFCVKCFFFYFDVYLSSLY